MSAGDHEARALAALDPGALQADLAAAVQHPSLTGQERPVLEWLAGRAGALGLRADLHEHDLAALRAHPDHPGEEAPREELLGLAAALPGAPAGGPRLALNGHVDVVGPGGEAWTHGSPFSGSVEDGFLYGRGSVDMKAGVIAALHALAAVRAAGVVPACEAVLLAVASEEDGGLGTFAALERDERWDAAVIPEPTAFSLVCAQAGATTFTGTVRGRGAHAALRLEGRSAIDRYVALHARLAEHERTVNASPGHALMEALELPYPLLVGKIEGGTWSSQVPDLVTFEGRVGVRLDETVAEARAAFEAACADGEDPAVKVRWTGGTFAPGFTDPDDPFVGLVRAAASDELGAPPPAVGVPYGADMRLFTARGIPCTMLGPSGIERAHGVDERVSLEEVEALARILIRVVTRFGA